MAPPKKKTTTAVVRRRMTDAARRPSPHPSGRDARPAPPFSGAHFRVLIGGTELGFCHVSRLQLADGPVGSEEADAGRHPRSVVLRRALSQDKALYRWRQRTAAGKEEPQIITVHQCEAGGDRILNTWLLHGCRPVRWSGPEFNALGGDLLWEELEVSWERLEWR